MSSNTALGVLAVLLATYFIVYSLLQIAMALPSSRFLWRHQRRNANRARARVVDLAARPQVSIVVPACNEEITVVATVRALLAIEYEPLEVVVINDGSADNTLDVLSRAFGLVAAPLAFAQPLPSTPVHASYRSIAEPRLVVIDKDKGVGKADALNAGINAASGALVLVVDADTVLDPESVSRAVQPFVQDPSTIAVGGNVAVANGCRIDGGRVARVMLPDSWLARCQIIENMRSFLLFRLACAEHNGVVLISGAFGMFQRAALLAVGGYDRTAIGEDMDLTIRLQRYYRERRIPFQIAFDPNALGWTQAPEDWASFRSQRYRWRRGLLQALWRHRRMIGNPRYGVVGISILPFMLVFEALGPILEITGYAGALAAGFLGAFYWPYLAAVMIIGLLFGVSVTLVAIVLSDIVTQRYMEGGDLVSLVIVAIGECIGYRQCNAWFSVIGTAQAMTRKPGWGAMPRRAF